MNGKEDPHASFSIIVHVHHAPLSKIAFFCDEPTVRTYTANFGLATLHPRVKGPQTITALSAIALSIASLPNGPTDTED